MGSNDGYSGEKPVYNVCLSSYRIDVHEVTQGEYSQVMGENPSEFKNCGSNCPVENVNWYQARNYCQKLGKRLPTEAEWEYAVRGGVSSRGYKYVGSNNPDDVAWYDDNSESTTHPVCTKQKNEIGLCDMSGNVLEWIADWYEGDYYRKSPIQDPKGPKVGDFRVNRGGCWFLASSTFSTTVRFDFSPYHGQSLLGFRCVLSSYGD